MFCIKIRLENLYSLLQSPVKLSTKSSPWHFFFPFQPKSERGNWQPLGRWAEKQARMWLNALQEKKGKKQLSQLHGITGKTGWVKVSFLHGSKDMIWLNISYSSIKLSVNLKWQRCIKIIPSHLFQNNSCYIWNYLVMVDVNRYLGVCLWRSVLGGFRTRRNSREGKTNVCWSREQVESKT